MAIPDEMRKCVVFLGSPLADGDVRIAGSAFLLGEDQGGHTSPTFIVTAKHVIDRIKAQGSEQVVIRVNERQQGTVFMVSDVGAWFSHPSDTSIDVAILEAGIHSHFDHLVIPTIFAGTEDRVVKAQVELGAEIFVVGLFHHHSGNRRNIPIVRVGSLAAFNEERIPINGFGMMDAYLVEMHSIGGLSGSPVLVRHPLVRLVDGTVRLLRGPADEFMLLGLMHGHFKDDIRATDVIARINTGIAIVVPIDRVLSVMAEYQHSGRKGKPLEIVRAFKPMD